MPEARYYPDLYVGLCGAVGTDLDAIGKMLRKEFASYNYKAEVINVSSLFLKLGKFSGIAQMTREAERIDASMEAGKQIREKFKEGDGAIRLAIADIHEKRECRQAEAQERYGTVYIIKSLKHPKEHETLSRIYQDAFIMLSVYEPKQSRRRNLCRKIAKSHKQRIRDCTDLADKLIDKDQKESGTDYGQQVSGIFQLGDAFVDTGRRPEHQIRRLVRLVFGAPFITPTRLEYGMFHAFAASLKSADLSRQVGAVVTTPNGEIICTGCNEVPRPGGGTAWEEDIIDKSQERRDFGLGYDSSAVKRREMLEEIVDAIKLYWLAPDFSNRATTSLVDDLLSKGNAVSLRDKRVYNIIEFGRIMHAEVSALSESARRGVPVQGCNLICTTFPCHMCARHIISSGISQVYYIEPYPKSLAKELYSAEILVDGEEPANNTAVRFSAFVGIAPRQFVKWFTMTERKDSEGWAVPEDGSVENRKIARTMWMQPDEESAYVDSLSELEDFDAE